MASQLASARAGVIDLLTRAHLLDFAMASHSGAFGLARAATGVDRKVTRDYLATARSPRLQIGCGRNPRPGWLNTDLYPPAGGMRLDATKTFPFPEAAFDFIYSEHMIEHIGLADGLHMLEECYRILRPGAVMRLATPDLDFLVGLVQHPDVPLHQAYIEWSANEFPDDPLATRPVDYKGQLTTSAVIVNNFVRDWHHMFVYDEPTLRQVLGRIGFEEVVRRCVDQSDVPELKGLENTDRMPEGFLELESLILEFRKPA
jgi:predicted SAM-dependent methyltransferase